MRGKPFRAAATIVAGGLTLFMAVPADARTWTRESDGKTIEATFVRFDGDNMILRLPNGREVPAPKSMFTKADIEAAEKFVLIGDNTNTLKAAAQIDNLLAQNLVKAGITSFNEPLPDDLFARRVYLDILGRIPTRKEFMAFAESPRPNKRQELIDESQETINNLRGEVRDVGDEAERASRETENSLELRTRDRYRKLLGKIDQALSRIDDGSYGYCEETGEEIGLARLEARPIATLCLDAQERWELKQKQMRDSR